MMRMTDRLDYPPGLRPEGLPHPDADELRGDAQRIVAWLLADFAALPERPVGLTAAPAQMQGWLREPLPETGQGLDAVLQAFSEHVAPYALRPNHPRFAAFIPSAPSYHAIMGDWLCAGINLFAGVWLEAAGATQVELVVLDWFKELLGFPAEASGILTGGGSEANLTALLVARERLSHAERDRAVLYVNQHRHWSVDRAARTIGLRMEQIRPIAAAADLRVHGDMLAEAISRDNAAGKLPWAMVATAGATSTGIVDDLATIAAVCRQYGVWFHVDAAYGWSAALIPAGRTLLRGIDRADSITLDPHKWFAQTFEAGCLLVREGRRLRDTFVHSPDYMQDVRPAEHEVNFSDLGLALSRRFRALKIWFSIKILGIGWFRALIEHTCALAEYGEQLLRRAGCFEILTPRSLSMVCFRYVPEKGKRTDEELDRLNLALCTAVRDSGRAFLSSTRLHERVALRFCFVNWRTTARDIEEIVDLLVSLVKKL